MLQINEHLQFNLDSYPGQVSIHKLKHKLFNTTFNLAPKQLQSKTPLKALTVFTDGSGASHKSVMTQQDPRAQMWESDVQVVEGSPQIVELAAMVIAFERFQEPFNLKNRFGLCGWSNCQSRACLVEGGCKSKAVPIALETDLSSLPLRATFSRDSHVVAH